MNPFAELSQENHEQIRKYLKFFRQKKDGTLRAVQSEVQDAIDDRLNDDMYTKEDVIDFADFMATSIKNQVGADIGTLINMGALTVSHLLESSQEMGIPLVLETSAVENVMLLDAVEKMSLDAVIRSPGKKGQLVSMKDEAKAMKDEVEKLEGNNRNLQERFTSVQNDASLLAKDKNRLQSEVLHLRERLESTSESKSSGRDGVSQADIARLQEDLEFAREENEKRVSDTTQFKQMRQLMQSKNNEIRDLRRRLDKYEPDVCEGKDDED